jgi:hypothetical protein
LNKEIFMGFEKTKNRTNAVCARLPKLMALIIAQRASTEHSSISYVHALKIAGSNPACEDRSCEPKAVEEQINQC